LELKPAFTDAWTNLGSALQIDEKYHEALAAHHRALELDPNHVEAHYNLGTSLQAQGRWDEALASYDQALRLKPEYAEARFNRSFVRLSRGEFAEGWPDYAWRLKCKKYPRRELSAPLWNGSPMPGRTILLHAEQGLGDTLQFIRYAPRVEQLANVVVEVQKPLIPLLEQSGYRNLIARGSPLPAFDVHAPLLSLPGILETTLETIPAEVPYLSAKPELVEAWRLRLAEWPEFRVGINWQGNSQFTFDKFRSVPLAEFAPLARAPGVRLVSLQRGEGLDQLEQLGAELSIVDLGPDVDQAAGAFMDTAAILKNLDLVVTSDTAMAHLAGALGVQVWLAVGFAPEWRWLQDRTDSPWYPTMRLFRQTKIGDWTTVFAEMADELVRQATANTI
jgi:tetratricopeptide (TPR) repeat protein